jgi:hypothetical protein
MANKRIKDLSTTAAVTASDDFIAVDGATNGTRKLDAYSPTFGGNLTVSGTTILSYGGSTSGGIDLLVNPTTKASGSLIDLQINSTSKFRVSSAGDITTSGGIAAGANIQTTGQITAGVGGGFNNPSWLIYQAATPGQLYIRDTVNGVMTAYFTAGTGVTGAMNLNGNLTVSGGQIAIAASSSTPSVLVTQTDPAAYSLFRLRNTGGTAQSYDFAVGGSGTGSLAQKFYVYDGTAGAVRLAIAPTTGNFLLKSDGVDSGNGRLQLATHTTSSGGIGFGTALSLFTITSNALRLSAASGGASFQITQGGAGTVEILTNGSDGYYNTQGAAYFRTNTNVTALTLDSSQRTILSGALRLANAYVATPQVTTGYVTIQDSTGTTYKVLVAT